MFTEDTNEEQRIAEENARINKYIRIGIVAVIAVALGLVIALLGTYVIAPMTHYTFGTKALENREYQDAIEEFAAAGDYKDAAEQLALAKQYYANFLAGKPDAVAYVSSAVSWLSIDENGQLAFANDPFEKSLEKMNLPENGVVTLPDVLDGILVTSIKDKTFLNADKMTAVNIPDSVGIVPDSCFYNCYSLVSVTLGKKVTAIEQRAFINCYLLSELVIPETVNRIGLRAFNNCYSLKKIEIPGEVEAIMPYTFSECVALETVSLPATVKSIAEGAFTGCEALKTVKFAGSRAEWDAITVGEGNEALAAAEIICAK